LSEADEIWKDIKGFENRYQISNLGNLRNSKTKQILKFRKNSRIMNKFNKLVKVVKEIRKDLNKWSARIVQSNFYVAEKNVNLKVGYILKTMEKLQE